MKLPINWLKDYVHIPESLEELTDKFTSIGHMQDHRPEYIGDDIVLDLEIRQNRSDCLSVIGLAREVAASLQTPLTMPKMDGITLPSLNAPSLITIKNKEACYRFHALTIDNIVIGESPAWLKQKLEAYGMKSINNLVDITNFVMIEMGEPLHAFDRAKIGEHITVRLANKGEIAHVLGGKKIELTPADLVITSDDKVIAIGGIIGGEDSGVDENTTSIILEAATYNQAYIRRSSIRHSLRTEASLRHEKFLHPDLTDVALLRAAGLISELCDGTVTAHYDEYVVKANPVSVQVSLQRLHSMCGVSIGMERSVTILNELGIVSKKVDADTISAQIPYFRTDIMQEADVIEEVLRIYGYDKIPDRLPHSPAPKEITSKSYTLEESMRDILVGYGFDEIITEPLVNESTSVHTPVRLQNSLNSEKTMLRTTLRYGLENALSYQGKAKRDSIQLFEIGKVYAKEADTYQERKVLAGIISSPTASYLRTKGILEALCIRLERKYTPDVITVQKLSKKIWYFEIQTESFLQLPQETMQSIQTSLPSIMYEDLSLRVPVAVEVGSMIDAVKQVSPFVYRVTLGEYPRDLKDGTKSVFLKLQYQKKGETITRQESEPVREKLLNLIEKKYKGSLRTK